MKRLRVTVDCVADLTEMWIIDVDDDVEVTSTNFIDILDAGHVHEVHNLTVDGERDRELISVEVEP